MSAPIEVVALRRTDGSSSVKCYVDLRLGGVTKRACADPDDYDWNANDGADNWSEKAKDWRALAYELAAARLEAEAR